jgi:hypothetical protein
MQYLTEAACKQKSKWKYFPKSPLFCQHRWLTPVILATQEAEIRKIVVQSQHRQIVQKTPSRKYPTLKRAS